MMSKPEVDPDTYKKRRGTRQPFDLFAFCPPGRYAVTTVVADLNASGRSFAYAVEQLAAQLKAHLGKRVGLERASEIFITGRNTRGGRVEQRRLSFYPQVNDYWISHFTIR